MSATYAIKANASPVQVSNTEVVVAGPLFIANTLAVGDAMRVRLVGTLDQNSQYTLNVRLGANGNVTDPAIYSSNNVITKAALLADLNSWSTNNPGFTFNEYVYSSPLPNVSQTPPALNGELMVVVTGLGGNGNVAIVAPQTQINPASLLAALGTGVLATSNANTTVNANLTVTMSMVGKGAYAFNPANGVEGPRNAWVYSQNPNTNTSTVTYSSAEVL
jgi:hypothetical protein